MNARHNGCWPYDFGLNLTLEHFVPNSLARGIIDGHIQHRNSENTDRYDHEPTGSEASDPKGAYSLSLVSSLTGRTGVHVHMCVISIGVGKADGWWRYRNGQRVSKLSPPSCSLVQAITVSLLLLELDNINQPLSQPL